MVATIRPSKSLIAVLAAAALVLTGLLASGAPPVGTARDIVLDAFLARVDTAPSRVTVVDIDRGSLERIGSWPWGRDRLAVLLEAIAEAKPAAVALDMLLAGEDTRSARALARQLAGATDDDRITTAASALARQLPDADQRLARAIAAAPTVLGLVLDPEASHDAPRPAPVLVQGKPRLPTFWLGGGTLGPLPLFSTAAAGHGALLLPGDGDASVRRVPLLVATPEGLWPGLAAEAARLSLGAHGYLLGGEPAALAAGPVRLALGPEGMLRLRPVSTTRHAARAIAAADVVADAGARARLAGQIVLVGSSAPELGGLRPTSSGALIPSVQVQGDAVEQILAADAPRRPRLLGLAEALSAFVGAALAIWAALTGSPLRAAAGAAVLAFAWLGTSYGLAHGRGLLLDPLLVPVVIILGTAGAILAAATLTRRREALIRRRFEQHLAPSVVQRIVGQPGLLKLEGESRVVTVLFTDIEGFTPMTERAEPAELVALLDRYIDGATRVVVEHGGMVEKIVGDGLHALFNAPLDLADHAPSALDCAEALLAFAERLREDPDAQRLRLGRTRIGIETGPVIVGDVGGGRRLDYTAYGNAMNRAARLEAANKELATSITVGPGAAALIGETRLRPLGKVELRGVGEPMEIFEPWPTAMVGGDRALWLSALARSATSPASALPALEALARSHPADAPLATMISRLRQSASMAS